MKFVNLVFISSIFSMFLVSAVSAKTSSVIVYKNSKYHFELLSASSCSKFFSIKAIPTKDGATLNVNVPLDKQWPKNSPWYSYTVTTISGYNAEIQDLESDPTSKPNPLVLSLKNNFLLTVSSPQDIPNSIGSCRLTEKVY